MNRSFSHFLCHLSKPRHVIIHAFVLDKTLTWCSHRTSALRYMLCESLNMKELERDINASRCYEFCYLHGWCFKKKKTFTHLSATVIIAPSWFHLKSGSIYAKISQVYLKNSFDAVKGNPEATENAEAIHWQVCLKQTRCSKTLQSFEFGRKP